MLPRRPEARSIAGAAIAAAVLVGGCAASRDFIWVGEVPKSMYAEPGAYRIEIGDVIGVRVYNQEANSVDRARVREDGKITMPFLGDVRVDGFEPTELSRALELKLKAFIKEPGVTVVVHERRPLRVSVLGRVHRAGTYDLDPGGGLLHALAAAGGLTPFADGDRVFVIRNGYWADTQLPARIRFRYDELVAGRSPAVTFRLRVGDVVVVE
jgi:polysaccharide export outer membrane protein